MFTLRKTFPGNSGMRGESLEIKEQEKVLEDSSTQIESSYK